MSVRLRALSACAAAALLAACSSSASTGSGSVNSGSAAGSSTASSPASSPASSSAPATSAPPTATGNAALSATALSTAAKRALLTATSFHMRGSEVSGGQTTAFDIHYGKTSSDGSITVKGARVDLRFVQPAVFLRGGKSFWQLIAASESTLTAAQKKSLVARLAGKWVRVPAGSSGLSDLSAIADRAQFQKQAAGDNSGGPYVKGPARTIGTARAVSFIDKSDNSSIYVAATGTAFPLEIVSPSEHSTFVLTDWNVPFTAPRPPASQTITLP